MRTRNLDFVGRGDMSRTAQNQLKISSEAVDQRRFLIHHTYFSVRPHLISTVHQKGGLRSDSAGHFARFTKFEHAFYDMPFLDINREKGKAGKRAFRFLKTLLKTK